MIDYEALDLEIRQHIVAAVPGIQSHDTAEALDDELVALRSAKVPAIFTLLEEESEGRKVVGARGERIRLRLRIGLVTRSLAGLARPLKGATGGLALRQAVKRSVAGWRPSAAKTAFEFERAEFAGRQQDRILQELSFTAVLWETFD